MSIRFSASRRALLDQCAYAFRDGVLTVDDPPGAPAILGTWVHELIEQGISGEGVPCPPPDGASAADIEAGRAMLRQFWDWFPAWRGNRVLYSIRVEVPFAYDVMTGQARELPSNGHRDYSQASPTEITGTVDFLARDSAGGVVLRDWKSTTRGNFWDLRDASPQLRTLALFVARAWDVSTVDVGAVHIAPHGVEERAFVVDALDLDADEWELTARLESIPAAEPQTGPACRFCAARASCPALSGSVSSADTNALVVLQRPGELAPDVVAKAYQQIRIIEERVTLAKARVKAEVERLGSVSLGGGRELRIVDVERENVSKASITKALGKDDGAALIDKLREIGAMTASHSKTMQEGKVRTGT